jgi:hypothetical protein
MARKRKKLQGFDYNSPEYWNRLLAEDTLSMEQGRNPKLTYVGGSSEVDKVNGQKDVEHIIGGKRNSPKLAGE